MKLKIWQQFSSNHSGSFTVVGVFDSPQQAEAAVTELTSIFQNLFAWYKANPKEPRPFLDDPPSSAEREIIEKYDLATEINLGLAGEDAQASLTTKSLDRFLILHIHETWWNEGQAGLATLVGKMGAGSKGMNWELNHDFMSQLTIRLRAIAPDEATAQAIFDETRAALDKTEKTGLWLTLDLAWCKEIMELSVEMAGRTLIFQLSDLYVHEHFTALIGYLQSHSFTDFDAELTEEITE